MRKQRLLHENAIGVQFLLVVIKTAHSQPLRVLLTKYSRGMVTVKECNVVGCP